MELEYNLVGTNNYYLNWAPRGGTVLSEFFFMTSKGFTTLLLRNWSHALLWLQTWNLNDGATQCARLSAGWSVTTMGSTFPWLWWNYRDVLLDSKGKTKDDILFPYFLSSTTSCTIMRWCWWSHMCIRFRTTNINCWISESIIPLTSLLIMMMTLTFILWEWTCSNLLRWILTTNLNLNWGTIRNTWLSSFLLERIMSFLLFCWWSRSHLLFWLLTTNINCKTTWSILFSAGFLLATMFSRLVCCWWNKSDVPLCSPIIDLNWGGSDGILEPDFLPRSSKSSTFSYCCDRNHVLMRLQTTNYSSWTTENNLLVVSILITKTSYTILRWYWNLSSVIW